jgi:hypothetical protein
VLPALDRNIDINRVELDSEADALAVSAAISVVPEPMNGS